MTMSSRSQRDVAEEKYEKMLCSFAEGNEAGREIVAEISFGLLRTPLFGR